MAMARLGSLNVAWGLWAERGVLLLDEQTAGMGREESLAFVVLLRKIREGRTTILVEHDMDVVFALADRITVLANGRIINTGTPAETRANPDVRTAYLGESEAD